MTWFKVDDNLCFHPKVMAAGNGAMGGWIRLGAHCSQHETDGFATALVVNAIFSPADLTAIMSTGMLVVLPDGRYEMHDYLKYNPSKAELTAKRAHWAERRGQDRRRVSHAVSHSDATSDTRECLTERPTKTPGRDRDLSPDLDLSPDPDGDSRRASGPRLKSQPPPPESVEPESGYDLAKRVFAEEWQAKYREPYNFDFVDAGPESENRVLQGLGGKAKERGEEAERWLRHVVKTYLRDHGHRDFLVGARHAAKYIRKSWQSYGNPPTAKPRVAPVRPAEPVAPALSAAELAAKLGSMGIGKIGMGGRQ